MLPVSYAVQEELTSPKWAAAFAQGCGGIATGEPVLQPGPMAFFGTPPRWPLLRQVQAEGRDWYYGDHGYWGRGRFYKIAKNRYQPSGQGEPNAGRWRDSGLCNAPWIGTGSHVLVCPNSDVYMALHGIDVKVWCQDVVDTLRQHTDREIRLRWKFQRTTNPLRCDLQDAWAVVVFSSNCAIDALMNGIPCFTLAPWASSAEMGLSDLSRIESPYYPDDRDRFMGVLAANQWTLDEMARGEAWETLRAQ